MTTKRQTFTLVMLIAWLTSALLVPAFVQAEDKRRADDSDLANLGREPLPSATSPDDAPAEPAVERPALPDPEPEAAEEPPPPPKKKKRRVEEPSDADGGADSEHTSSAGPRATSSDDAPLIDQAGEQTTFGEALGGGARVVVFTKPWSDANAQIIGELSHYRLRLNRGGLRSGVIFLRSERDEALRAMETFKGRVKWWIDADGGLAKLLGVTTLPALMLIDADGNVKFAAPLLNDELVKQLAKNYNKPETVFRAPRPVASPRVGIPPAKGGVGRYSIR